MELLIVMAIVAVVAVFVTVPLRREQVGARRVRSEVQAARQAIEELEAAREAKYREIRDAELDHGTGKLSARDFESVDAALRAEAVQILKALDDARRRYKRVLDAGTPAPAGNESDVQPGGAPWEPPGAGVGLEGAQVQPRGAEVESEGAQVETQGAARAPRRLPSRSG